MEKTPDTFVPIQITDELIQEWLDSFCPSAKTFATNFIINLVPRYGYDYLAQEGYGEILSVMSEHFVSFLELRAEEMCPGRILTDLCVVRE